MTQEFFSALPDHLIERPVLLLEEKVARRNIRTMAEKARRNGVLFRPHFKTHRSAHIAGWFRDEGIRSITVSSLRMAAYFAENGWDDITVAFPVNLRETALINELAGRISLSLIASSPVVIRALDRSLSERAGLFVEIDTSYGRSGVRWDHSSRLEEVIRTLHGCRHLHFRGLLSHTGDTYAATSREEILMLHRKAVEKLKKLKKRFADDFEDCLISLGDTPSFSLLQDIEGIDEMRPGNFVFYDMMQSRLGACSPEEIAVAVACPVVEVHPDEHKTVIYGGAVHLSKESLPAGSGSSCFGRIIDPHAPGKVREDTFVYALSQEHGLVTLPPGVESDIRPGDLLYIYPVHSCLTANLYDAYLTSDGKWIESMRSI